MSESAPKKMSIAEKMMAKMGHVEGQGLDKEGAGISEPIIAKMRPERAGLGAANGIPVIRPVPKNEQPSTTIMVSNLETLSTPQYVARLLGIWSPFGSLILEKEPKITEIYCPRRLGTAWITFETVDDAEAVMEAFGDEFRTTVQSKALGMGYFHDPQLPSKDEIKGESRSPFWSDFLLKLKQFPTTKNIRINGFPTNRTEGNVRELLEDFDEDIKHIHASSHATADVELDSAELALNIVRHYDGAMFKNQIIQIEAVPENEIVEYDATPMVLIGPKNVGFLAFNVLPKWRNLTEVRRMFHPIAIEDTTFAGMDRTSPVFVFMTEENAARYLTKNPKFFYYKGAKVQVKLKNAKNDKARIDARAAINASENKPTLSKTKESLFGAVDVLADKATQLTVAAPKKPQPAYGRFDVRVNNLHFDAKQKDVEALFKGFRTTKFVMRKNFAWVGLQNKQEAERAVKTLSGKLVLRRPLYVSHAPSTPPSMS